MNYRKNLSAGLVLASVSFIYLYMTTNIRPFKGIGATPLDNRAIPVILGVMLLCFALTLILRAVLERRAAVRAGAQAALTAGKAAQTLVDNRKAVLTFVFLVIYVALLGPVGFVPMSAAFIFALAMTLEPPNRKLPRILSALLSLAMAQGIYHLFGRVLLVLLPRGLWPF